MRRVLETPPDALSQIVKGVSILVFCMSVALAEEARPEKPATPAEKYQALLKEQPNGTLARRFVELAEGNSKDPVALEALIQAISIVSGSIFPDGSKDSPGERALALVLRDHVRSDKLGPVCQQVLFGFHKSRETFLRAVLEANPHRHVQGLACLSLAQYLDNRRDRLDVLRAQDQDRPEMVERYNRAFGKDYLEELHRQDRAALATEIEMLFARAADQYSDVEIPVTYFGSGGTIGKKAEAELFKIRYLAVGKEAPEIEGEDQDGKHFKLTDYRGKVVLLDIWHHL